MTESEPLQKFLNRLSDPEAADASLSDSVDQKLKNVDVARSKDAGLCSDALRLKLTQAGYAAGENPIMKLVDLGGLGAKFTVATHAAWQDDENQYLQSAVQTLIHDKEEDGLKGNKGAMVEANMLRLTFGGATDTVIPGTNQYTGDDDAERYARVAARLKGNVGLQSFLQYDAKLNCGDTAGADAVMAKMVKADEAMERGAANYEAASRKAKGLNNNN